MKNKLAGASWATLIALGVGGGCGDDSAGSSGAGGAGASGGMGGSGASIGNLDIDVEACAAGATDAEIEANIAITGDLNASCHEFIVCGGMTFAMAFAVVEVFAEFVTAGAASPPDGYSYDGAGTYHIEADGFTQVAMDLQFLWPAGYEGGAEGELIEHDLFSFDSYLVGATIDIDLLSGDAQIDFDSPGPLVELMGFGADPPNPIVASLGDLENAAAELEKLPLESVVALTDDKTNTVIQYDIRYEQMTVGDYLAGQNLGIQLIGGSGTKEVTDQSLILDSLDVAYVDGGIGALDGTIDFHVDGGAFPFVGTFDYPSSNAPNVVIRCP